MIDLSLQRVSRLLAKISTPWRAVHVAGTNGKGSICAYISSMLDAYNRSALRRHTQQSLLRHGRFTSPHLVDRWDCISIEQKTIAFSVFAEVEERVRKRNRQASIEATEFELLTATAFEIFTQEKLDVVVVEVGMGGRLDATNLIGQANGLEDTADAQTFRPPPLATVISSIGLDHREFLGDTLQAIATEKAGIMKPNVPVIYDDSNPEVIKVILEAAAAKNCPVDVWALIERVLPGFKKVHCKTVFEEGDSLSYTPAHVQRNFNLANQAFWAALWSMGRLPKVNPETLKMLDELENDLQSVRHSTHFPGRQQKLSIEGITGRKQDVLLDGAHNHQSALALADATERLRKESAGKGTVTWILAASSTKDVKDILSPMIQDGDSIFAVEFGPVDGMPWVKPLASSELLQAAKTVVSNPGTLYLEACGTDLRLALQAASQKAAEGPLVIGGSLYLVGDVLRLLR